jgi:hypothetical protein
MVNVVLIDTMDPGNAPMVTCKLMQDDPWELVVHPINAPGMFQVAHGPLQFCPCGTYRSTILFPMVCHKMSQLSKQLLSNHCTMGG